MLDTRFGSRSSTRLMSWCSPHFTVELRTSTSEAWRKSDWTTSRRVVLSSSRNEGVEIRDAYSSCTYMIAWRRTQEEPWDWEDQRRIWGRESWVNDSVMMSSLEMQRWSNSRKRPGMRIVVWLVS